MNAESPRRRRMREAADAPTIAEGLIRIGRSVSLGRRRQFYLLLTLLLAGALAETATIGAVIPFIALLANKQNISPHWLHFLPPTFADTDPTLVAGTGFILFALVAGILRFALAASTRSFVFGLCHDLSVTIQRRILSQPYAFHLDRNMSTLISAVDKVDSVVVSVILPLTQALSGTVVAICLIAFLTILNPLLTLTVLTTLAATYGLFSLLFHRGLHRNGEVLKTAYDKRMQVLQESLGGVRELIIDHSLRFYIDHFRRVDLSLARTRTSNDVIALAPHYLIETLALILMAAVALWMSHRGDGITAAITLLGTLALAAQRLLPLVHNIYRAWAGIDGHRHVFNQVSELLSLPAVDSDPQAGTLLPLRKAMHISDLSFSYANQRTPAVADISLVIEAGAMVALTGETGSGKTTLADLMMGLLRPSSGSISIDRVELCTANVQRWYRTVAHVPQNLFLADASIRQNIALSLPDDPIEEGRIIAAAEQAGLDDFIQSLPDRYDTLIGERGVRLSGGQRQRLGIARAIYKDAPVLILDEATSALDERTEDFVIQSLKSLQRRGRTIIMIAHRRSTIEACDVLIRLESGRIATVSRRG